MTDTLLSIQYIMNDLKKQNITPLNYQEYDYQQIVLDLINKYQITEELVYSWFSLGGCQCTEEREYINTIMQFLFLETRPCLCSHAGHCSVYDTTMTDSMFHECQHNKEFRKSWAAITAEKHKKMLEQQKNKEELAAKANDFVAYLKDNGTTIDHIKSTHDEKGLGTLVESALSSIGITQESYKDFFGLEECNCTERKEWLNAISGKLGLNNLISRMYGENK